MIIGFPAIMREVQTQSDRRRFLILLSTVLKIISGCAWKRIMKNHSNLYLIWRIECPSRKFNAISYFLLFGGISLATGSIVDKNWFLIIGTKWTRFWKWFNFPPNLLWMCVENVGWLSWRIIWDTSHPIKLQPRINANLPVCNQLNFGFAGKLI